MPKYQQTDEEISDGVNLLISILVRYPEIGKISFEPDKNLLRFTFMLSGKPNENELIITKKLLLNSIEAYHMLEGLKNAKSEIQLNTYGPQVAILTIIRDVFTLTKGEIAVIISLLRERLKECLSSDHNEAMLEEDLLMQEELIDNMLESVKKQGARCSLIGIREDGRVLVFNK